MSTAVMELNAKEEKAVEKAARIAELNELAEDIKEGCKEWLTFDRGKLAIALKYGPKIQAAKDLCDTLKLSWGTFIQNHFKGISQRTINRWKKVSNGIDILEKYAKSLDKEITDFTLEEAEAEIKSVKPSQPRGATARKVEPEPKPEGTNELAKDTLASLKEGVRNPALINNDSYFPPVQSVADIEAQQAIEESKEVEEVTAMITVTATFPKSSLPENIIELVKAGTAKIKFLQHDDFLTVFIDKKPSTHADYKLIEVETE